MPKKLPADSKLDIDASDRFEDATESAFVFGPADELSGLKANVAQQPKSQTQHGSAPIPQNYNHAAEMLFERKIYEFGDIYMKASAQGGVVTILDVKNIIKKPMIEVAKFVEEAVSLQIIEKGRDRRHPQISVYRLNHDWVSKFPPSILSKVHSVSPTSSDAPISKRIHPTKHLYNTQEKLAEVERHADKFGSIGLAELITNLFPVIKIETESQSSTQTPRPLLPQTAPEIYQGLRGPETPPQFVQRVYIDYLGAGLTRAHIRKLDPGLAQAINNWSRKNNWPEDIDLPTLKEENSRWVDRVKSQGLNQAIEGMSANEALRAANRFHGAKHRRKEK